MYVYLPSVDNLFFTVGFYEATEKGSKWHRESRHSSSEAAAARVAYLNGGGNANEQAMELLRYIATEIVTMKLILEKL